MGSGSNERGDFGGSMVYGDAIRNLSTSYRRHMCTGFNCPLHQMARANPKVDSASL